MDKMTYFRCLSCGYNLGSISRETRACPECGHDIAESKQAQIALSKRDPLAHRIVVLTRIFTTQQFFFLCYTGLKFTSRNHERLVESIFFSLSISSASAVAAYFLLDIGSRINRLKFFTKSISIVMAVLILGMALNSAVWIWARLVGIEYMFPYLFVFYVLNLFLSASFLLYITRIAVMAHGWILACRVSMVIAAVSTIYFVVYGAMGVLLDKRTTASIFVLIDIPGSLLTAFSFTVFSAVMGSLVCVGEKFTCQKIKKDKT